MNALNNQIGGNHYKSMQMQPIELISKLKLNYFQGNIVKYISRNKDNKIEDLEKAKHYCELAIELDKRDNIFKQIYKALFYDKKNIKRIEHYYDVNYMYSRELFIFTDIYCKEYQLAIKEINVLLINAYRERNKQKIDEEINKIIDKKATKGGIEINISSENLITSETIRNAQKRIQELNHKLGIKNKIII